MTHRGTTIEAEPAAAPAVTRPAAMEPYGRRAAGYPEWFEGVTDQAGKPVSVFCVRCGAQLTVLGCTVPPWTGYIIHPHRCRQ